MGSEWSSAPLEEVAEVIDSRHKTPQYADEGLPMVRVVDVKGGRLNLDDTKKVSQVDYEDYSKGRDPEIGDLLISRVGSYGNIAYVDNDEKFCLGQNTALIIPKIHWRYLYYQLISPSTKAQIEQQVVGAVQKTISLKTIRALEIPLPPLPEQKAIAHILGTLDDKIELNRRMNATLEGMAQALFKSWFVDFDPVIDNALAAGNPIPDELAPRARLRQSYAGRAEVRKKALANGTTQQGSLDHPTLPDPKSLFPASFEFSDELGPIPKGWDTRKLSELTTVTKGKSYKSSELQSSTTALVTLKSFNRGGGYRLDGLKEYTGSYKPEQMVKSGDLIISYTDVTQAADVIGKPAMVIPDERYETLVISLDVGVIWPIESNLKHFLYQLAHTQRFEDWMLSHTSGTTVLHLSKSAFPSFECAFPDEELISEFDKIVSTLFERTVQNVKESRVLIKLRDTLLPKLISGELRISEAKHLTKEALT